MVTLLVLVKLRLLTAKFWSTVAVPPVVAKFRFVVLPGNCVSVAVPEASVHQLPVVDQARPEPERPCQ